jgi:hypothetical protein
MTPVLAAEFNPIDIVMVWGVFAALLWFLLTALKRGHKTNILRVRIAVEETRQQFGDDEDLARILDEIAGNLQEAENRGPLWGRRPLSAAHGAIAALVARVEAGDWGDVEYVEEGDENGEPTDSNPGDP